MFPFGHGWLWFINRQLDILSQFYLLASITTVEYDDLCLHAFSLPYISKYACVRGWMRQEVKHQPIAITKKKFGTVYTYMWLYVILYMWL